jgi:hypothetical protein
VVGPGQLEFAFAAAFVGEAAVAPGTTKIFGK